LYYIPDFKTFDKVVIDEFDPSINLGLSSGHSNQLIYYSSNIVTMYR